MKKWEYYPITKHYRIKSIVNPVLFNEISKDSLYLCVTVKAKYFSLGYEALGMAVFLHSPFLFIMFLVWKILTASELALTQESEKDR